MYHRLNKFPFYQNEELMRKIITTTFITVDGVMQAPGAPGEDTSGKFQYGGWSFHYWDEMMGQLMDSFMKMDFELLLGRFTYDIFAAHWPKVHNEPVADHFNTTRKYVVSRQPRKLEWSNSTLVTGDTMTEIQKIKKEPGHDLWVHGSGNLIQSLLENNLIDRMHLWIFPVTVGKGKRLFASGTQPAGLKLIDSKISTTGVFIGTYEPDGQLKTGTFALQP